MAASRRRGKSSMTLCLWSSIDAGSELKRPYLAQNLSHTAHR